MPTSDILSPTEASAFPWILEHLLHYPGTYEIPLRTMYTSNILAQSTHKRSPSQPNHPPHHHHHQQHQHQHHHHNRTPSLSNSSSANSSPTSPETPQFSSPHHHLSSHQTGTDHFKTCLVEQLQQSPCQPFSLPPSFITSFVRRCFTEDLYRVDFTQALTALDYLKDLENRRKREISAAFHRLGIDKNSFGQDGTEINKRHPGIADWVMGMEDKERRVEALYTQVYIGLRRWTLINEMRLEPFNKANCVAMLNTLYPPSTPFPPTQQLTSTILASQRHAFFRYIQAVAKNGKSVLTNLENQSRRSQDENGWPVVREIVDKYLRSANAIIDECFTVTVDIFRNDVAEVRKAERRADSGISFGSGDRPSTDRPSTSSGSPPRPTTIVPMYTTDSALNKPLPASPRPDTDTTFKKTGSTLERIAREIRRMKSRSGEKQDSEPMPNSENTERSLKKMKSTSAIGRTGSSKTLGSKHSRGTSGDRAALFEIDDEQREKMISDAKVAREREREKENRRQRTDGNGGKKIVWGGVIHGQTF